GLLRFRVREWRLLALAYLLGWAVLGSVLTFLLIAGVAPGVATVLLAAAAVAAACFFVGRRVPKTDIVSVGRRAHPLAVLAALTGALVLVGSAASALVVSIGGTWPSEWDVWSFWLPKAKAIYYHGLGTGLGSYGSFDH